jgi:hypothetical protein
MRDVLAPFAPRRQDYKHKPPCGVELAARPFESSRPQSAAPLAERIARPALAPLLLSLTNRNTLLVVSYGRLYDTCD